MLVPAQLSYKKKKVKAKLSLLQAVEAHEVLKRRGSHIFWTIGSNMAMRLLALRAVRPPFTPRNIPGAYFCRRLSRLKCRNGAGRIRSVEKSNDLMGTRNHDLSACSITLQPTTLPHAPRLTDHNVITLLLLY
jgi:hypothetical protein